MDRTPYERSNQNRQSLSGTFGLGRITAVFPDERMCAVRTFCGEGPLQDMFIPKCQWLNLDANPQGDENTCIPRPDSLVFVFFVDGEPFVFGMFKPLDFTTKVPPVNKDVKVNEGDKIVSTIGGNRIVVKANGVVEIHSKDTLRTLFFPTDSRFLQICANLEEYRDGGTVKWENINDLNETLFTQEFRRDVLRTFIMVEERGAVSTDIIRRTAMGVGVPGVEGVTLPMYLVETDITGKTTFAVQPPGTPIGFRAEVNPTGAFNIKTGATPQFELDVGITGETKMSINALATILISATGDVSIKNPAAEVSMSATGDIKLKSVTTAALNIASGKVALGNAAAELLDLFDKTIGVLDKTLTAAQTIIVGTGTGPSTVPTNAAQFAAAQVELAAIKALLGAVKGGL